jgi:hypothetical protein
VETSIYRRLAPAQLANPLKMGHIFVQNDPLFAAFPPICGHEVCAQSSSERRIDNGERTMHFTSNTAASTAAIVSQVRTFVMDERKNCVSDREWKFRLKGYGYDLRQTERGTVLTTLPQGVEICTLDA